MFQFILHQYYAHIILINELEIFSFSNTSISNRYIFFVAVNIKQNDSNDTFRYNKLFVVSVIVIILKIERVISLYD